MNDNPQSMLDQYKLYQDMGQFTDEEGDIDHDSIYDYLKIMLKRQAQENRSLKEVLDEIIQEINE